MPRAKDIVSSKKLAANEVLDELKSQQIYSKVGKIELTFDKLKVRIQKNDSVGSLLQEWLGAWMKKNCIYFREQPDTQKTPDYYLCEDDIHNLLEIKSYNAKKAPAFDIANFDSYCERLKTHACCLDTDYLIFAYDLTDGILSIKTVVLKKVWEIAGPTTKGRLKTQDKGENKKIYNIRPVSFNSTSARAVKPYGSKAEFVYAIYERLSDIKSTAYCNDWIRGVIDNYNNYCGVDLLPDLQKEGLKLH